MGQALKALCELINNAIYSWSATARFVIVLFAIAVIVRFALPLALLIATAFAPWPSG
jgi:hypothetical protein